MAKSDRALEVTRSLGRKGFRVVVIGKDARNLGVNPVKWTGEVREFAPPSLFAYLQGKPH